MCPELGQLENKNQGSFACSISLPAGKWKSSNVTSWSWAYRGFNQAVNGFPDDGWAATVSDGMDDVSVVLNESPTAKGMGQVAADRLLCSLGGGILCAKASMLLQVRIMLFWQFLPSSFLFHFFIVRSCPTPKAHQGLNVLKGDLSCWDWGSDWQQVILGVSRSILASIILCNLRSHVGGLGTQWLLFLTYFVYIDFNFQWT